MGTFELVVKKCGKCGHRQGVRARERRCKQVVPGWMPGSERLCYGALTKVTRKAPQRTLEQELSAAHAQLANAITKVKRAVTSVDHWQRKIKAIGRRIDDRDHPKPKQPKPRKRTRAITLPPEDE